jgi:hypothetical protein
MLCEASEFERDLRTILLPGLLEYQQAIQEDMIDKWKLILRDAIDCCNRCSSSFQVGMVKICETVAGISLIGQFHEFFFWKLILRDFARSFQVGMVDSFFGYPFFEIVYNMGMIILK